MYLAGELDKCQNCTHCMDDEQLCEIYEEGDMEFDNADDDCLEFDENQTEESDLTERPFILAGTLECCEGCKFRLNTDSCICDLMKGHAFQSINETCEAKR